MIERGLCLKLKHFNSADGFSLTELIVVVGVSSVVALGTIASIVSGVKSQADQMAFQENAGIASEISRQLTSYTSQGQLSANSIQKTNVGNCNGTIAIDAQAVNSPQSAQATTALLNNRTGKLPLAMTLTSGNRTIASGTSVFGAKKIDISSLYFTNAANISNDATSSTWTGDIFVLANQTSATNNTINAKPTYVSRAVLSFDSTAATTAPTITRCQIAAQVGAASQALCQNQNIPSTICANNIEKAKVTETVAPLCLPGTFTQGTDGVTPSVCVGLTSSPCLPGHVVVGMKEGQVICSTDTPLLSAPTAAPIHQGNDETCKAYQLSLTACQRGNALGVNCALLPTPPQCGLNALSPQATINSDPPPGPTTTATTACQCGAVSIISGQYCGYCSIGTDVGYGYAASASSSQSSIQYCNAGNLENPAQQVAAVTGPSATATCNQQRMLVACAAGANGLTCAFP